ncbi:MAG: ABC transporter permease [Desulfobacteraceae bacterium]|nr:ABC transporter permease [Desulfobacteraceae bacterium]
MNFSIIADNLGIYFLGLKNTLILVSVSLSIGLVFAVPLAVLRTSKNILISGPINAYTYFFRGTPLLVQMFLIYYGMGQFESVKNSFLWPFFREAYFCALFAFTLNTCAYTIEIIRGAIENTPHGEVEAAKAAGMSLYLRFTRIILPSAFRRALPTYGNEIIFMLHGSSLASVITIIDITGAARIINSRYYTPYEAFITAGAFYLTITFILVWLLKKLEYRWLAHLRRE